MSKPGNRENSGRTLSTADLAAAVSRPNSVADDTVADDDAEATLNEERMPRAPGRENEITGHSLGGHSLGVTETRPRHPPRNLDLAHPATDQAAIDQAPAEAASDSREALEPLFTPELAETYRGRWAAIQSGFVDDPRRAVRSGDELVAQIMTNLANTFAEERHRVETQLDDSGEGSTENLRIALRRYRSFFERLLSL